MRFLNVTGNPDASGVLFDLLAERPSYAWISHGVMPSRAEHEAFVANHPFRYWYLVQSESFFDGMRATAYVGALECTFQNEIGVHILKRYQRRGYGSAALRKFIQTHEPLPPIKAVRNGRWLANIAMANDGAKEFFSAHGFAPLQETWVA